MSPSTASAAQAAAGRAVLPAYLALVAAALFWGGNWPLARWVQDQIPPLTLGLVRWGSAAILLLPLPLPPTLRAWPVLRRQWRRLPILGWLGVTGFSALSYTGLTFTTAINGSLINTASPVFLILFSTLGLGERLGRAELAGVALSLAGVVVIVTRGAPETLSTLAFNLGDLFVLAAVLEWTLYTILIKRWPTALPPMVFLFTTIVFSLPLPIILSAVELAAGARVPEINAVTVATAFYLGLFPSIGSYMCWNYGVARVGPGRAILFQYLIPVFAAALAILLLGEEPRLFHMAGAALVIGGPGLAPPPAGRPRIRGGRGT